MLPIGRGVMKFHHSVLLFFCLAIAACSAGHQNPSLRTLWVDHVAEGKVKAKNYEEALNLYFNLLEQNSDLSEIHSNIGNLLLLNKKDTDGLKSLEQALKIAEAHEDKKNEFIAHYNLGVYFSSQKKIPEALQHYQAALEVVPASKEVKTNIELLIQSGSSKNDSKDGDKKDQKPGEGSNSKDGSENKDKKDPSDKKDKGDGKDGKDKKDDESDQGDKKEKQMKQNAKYKPRPFQGDQLSEGDVKKILGELKSQEQKIRANFDKKERKENKNEKDW